MDILVMLEESPDASPVLAHVNSVPSPLDSERPTRDVVTLFGVPDPEALALALAATVELHRSPGESAEAIRHLRVWPERGAVGDAAWRDSATGELVTRDLAIPLETLGNTARQLLSECGHLIQRLIAGLSMPDWPEGVRRAITFTMSPVFLSPALAAGSTEAFLETLREADGETCDGEGD
jgi:hypothetical protein